MENYNLFGVLFSIKNKNKLDIFFNELNIFCLLSYRFTNIHSIKKYQNEVTIYP